VVVQVLEIVVPDVHLELHESGWPPLMLAWPMHAGIDWGGLRHSQSVGVTAFIEPELVPSSSAARFAMGSRVGFRFGGRTNEPLLSLLAEAGGLVGTDGHGGFLGAGFGEFTLSEKFTFCALIYRYVLTTEAPRHDLGLDIVTMPF
jgi:hypothetical protein